LTKIEFAYDWLFELSRILRVNMDYSEESHHDVLVRNTTIQLCLCIQNSLGFKGEFNARTFSGKFAWLVLQLRNIVVLVTMAANLNVPQGGPNSDKTSPLEDPGCLPFHPTFRVLLTQIYRGDQLSGWFCSLGTGFLGMAN
jgi:mediator of RNA polymerase II transcription subunit 16